MGISPTVTIVGKTIYCPLKLEVCGEGAKTKTNLTLLPRVNFTPCLTPLPYPYALQEAQGGWGVGLVVSP